MALRRACLPQTSPCCEIRARETSARAHAASVRAAQPCQRPASCSAVLRFSTTCSVARNYSASRSLRLQLRELRGAPSGGASPLASYLNETERVVTLSFPDEERRRRLDKQNWRVRLLPIELLWLRAGVECTLRAWTEAGSGVLQVSGREVQLSGLPDDVLELAGSLQLRVDGTLRAAGPSLLVGSVRLRIAVIVPTVLAIVPGVDAVVDAILSAVLQRIEDSIRSRLPADYALWASEQQTLTRLS